MRKKKNYAHLDQFARDRLEALLRSGASQKEAAEILKIDKSTVSREVSKRKRMDGRYDAWLAGHKGGGATLKQQVPRHEDRAEPRAQAAHRRRAQRAPLSG